MNIESHFTLLYLVNNKRGKGRKGTWATHSLDAGKLKIYSQCNPTLLKTLSIVVQLVKLGFLGGKEVFGTFDGVKLPFHLKVRGCAFC